MRHWVWWSVAGLLGFVACGGTSARHAGGGAGGSPDGGTSGSAGSSAGKAGAPAGGTSPTGGRGGGGTAGVVGGGGRGGTGGSDGGDGNVGGIAGDGGSAGEPGCVPGPADNDCSRAETCEVFSCGEPWSLYDSEGCARTLCTASGACAAGERCVPAPVLGKYGAPCFYEPDSCAVSGSSCSCLVYEECGPRALCVPRDEFPPERDCSFVGTDCVALTSAVEAMQAYRDGTEFFFPYEPPDELAASVEACAEKLAGLLQAECD